MSVGCCRSLRVKPVQHVIPAIGIGAGNQSQQTGKIRAAGDKGVENFLGPIADPPVFWKGVHDSSFSGVSAGGLPPAFAGPK